MPENISFLCWCILSTWDDSRTRDLASSHLVIRSVQIFIILPKPHPYSCSISGETQMLSSHIHTNIHWIFQPSSEGLAYDFQTREQVAPCNPSRSTLILKQECLLFPHCRPLDSPVKSATLTWKINFSSFYKAAKSQRLLEANAGSGEQLHGLCSTEQHPERKAKGPSLTLGWGELL